jgi:hypothetical protein
METFEAHLSGPTHPRKWLTAFVDVEEVGNLSVLVEVPHFHLRMISKEKEENKY